MSKPIVVDVKPQAVPLNKGEEYYWCSCGRSKNQPFCDGSHQGTSMVPKAFTAEETGDAYLCLCKHSKNPPYCDGSHAKLPSNSKGNAIAVTNVNEVVATPEEPTVKIIHDLAEHGLSKIGHHGEMTSMGVPLTT